MVFAKHPHISDEERKSVSEYIAAIRSLLDDERAVASRFQSILSQSRDRPSGQMNRSWILPAANYFHKHSRELAQRFWALQAPASADGIRSSWGKYFSALVACAATARPAFVSIAEGAPYEDWMAEEYEFSKLRRVYERACKDALRTTTELASRLAIQLDEIAASD